LYLRNHGSQWRQAEVLRGVGAPGQHQGILHITSPSAEDRQGDDARYDHCRNLQSSFAQNLIPSPLFAEMEGSTLTLRALNDTKSAFGAVEFSESYFDSFELASTLKTFSCKVNVKVGNNHAQIPHSSRS
jgi:hypothetical protein